MQDDDRDALAAEYVLGTLSADERDQAEAMLLVDPGFAEIVRVWERRLGELNVMVEAVEPSSEVWDKIKSEIGIGVDEYAAKAAKVESVLPAIEEAVLRTPLESAPEIAPGPTAEAPPELPSEPAPPEPQDLDDSAAVAALASSLLPPEPPRTEEPAAGGPAAEGAPSLRFDHPVADHADVVYLRRKAGRWQGMTAAISAVAALLAIYIAVDRLAPGLLPRSRPVSAPVTAAAPPPASRLVAVLQQEPTAPAFLVTVDPEARTITVRRMTTAADAGRSYELWLIPNKSPKPASLGVVGGDEFTTRPLPANLDVDAMRAASYAVSLEPAGGSTRGAPTGPILFTGKMVESVPGARS